MLRRERPATASSNRRSATSSSILPLIPRPPSWRRVRYGRPVQAVEAFVAKNRKEAEEAIDRLTKEAEALRRAGAGRSRTGTMEGAGDAFNNSRPRLRSPRNQGEPRGVGPVRCRRPPRYSAVRPCPCPGRRPLRSHRSSTAPARPPRESGTSRSRQAGWASGLSLPLSGSRYSAIQVVVRKNAIDACILALWPNRR